MSRLQRDGRTTFTIGHSNHPLATFLELLNRHRIEAVADVRSAPVSRYVPHFERAALRKSLSDARIRYLFLGRELGGRPRGSEFYDGDGRVLYGRVAASPSFSAGLQRLETAIQASRVAIMCGEEDPTGCHRRLLIGRVLAGRGVVLEHIRGDGRLDSEQDLAALPAAGSRGEGQLALFDEPMEAAWKSTRSASRRSRQRPSSGR